METRANYVLIGAFTLAVVAAAFGFVYWFSNLGDHGVRDTYRVAFDGTVSMLVGSLPIVTASLPQPLRASVLLLSPP